MKTGFKKLWAACLTCCLAAAMPAVWAADETPAILSHPNVADAQVVETAEPLVTFTEGDKVGLKRGDTVVAAAEWDKIELEESALQQEGLPICIQSGDRWGLLTADGTEVLLAPEYKEVKPLRCFDEVYIRVLDFSNNYGLLDASGEVLLDIKYAFIDTGIYEKTQIEVGRDYGYTIADIQTGEELLPLQTDWVCPSQNRDYFVCRTEADTYYLINKAGEVLVQTDDTYMKIAGDNALLVAQGDRWGLLDFAGNELIPREWETLHQPAYGEILMAGSDTERAYFDLQGNLIGGRTWEDCPYYWYSGTEYPDLPKEQLLFHIKKDGKYGFMDRQGTVVVPPIYDSVNGMVVRLADKTGILGSDGSYLVEPVWTSVTPDAVRFYSGYYTVLYHVPGSEGDVNYGLLDARGNVIFEPVYEAIYWNEASDGTKTWRLVEDGIQYDITLADTLTPLSDAMLRGEQLDEPTRAMMNAGVLQGYADGSLRLGERVTRAEFLTMLSRLEGWTTPAASTAFSDAKGHWGEAVIAAAVEKGLASGYADGTFRPDSGISFDEAFTILLRAKGFPEDVVADQSRKGFAISALGLQDAAQRSFSWAEEVNRQEASRLLYIYQTSDVLPEDVDYSGLDIEEPPPTNIDFTD